MFRLAVHSFDSLWQRTNDVRMCAGCAVKGDENSPHYYTRHLKSWVVMDKMAACTICTLSIPIDRPHRPCQDQQSRSRKERRRGSDSSTVYQVGRGCWVFTMYGRNVPQGALSEGTTRAMALNAVLARWERCSGAHSRFLPFRMYGSQWRLRRGRGRWWKPSKYAILRQ